MATVTVDSMVELRGLAAGVTGDDRAILMGYYDINDGGQGGFAWDTTSTEDDNGGTIILPDGYVGIGRWKRVCEPGVLAVRWFGAVGDYWTDDTAAFLACKNALPTTPTDPLLSTARGGGTMLLGYGNYSLSDTFLIDRHMRIEGVNDCNTGWSASVVNFPQDTTGFRFDYTAGISANNGSGSEISRVAIWSRGCSDLANLYSRLDCGTLAGGKLDTTFKSLRNYKFRGQTPNNIQIQLTGDSGGGVTITETGTAGRVDGIDSKIVIHYESGVSTVDDVENAIGVGWTGLTVYGVGDHVSHDGKLYICITGGTSAPTLTGTGPAAVVGGPFGTTSDIVDGTVHWDYVSDGPTLIQVDVPGTGANVLTATGDNFAATVMTGAIIANGVEFRVAGCKVFDFDIRNFPSSGVDIHADATAPDPSEVSNAQFWRLERGEVYGVLGAGVYVYGHDVNVGTALQVNCSIIGRQAFRDEGDFANLYLNCHGFRSGEQDALASCSFSTPDNGGSTTYIACYAESSALPPHIGNNASWFGPSTSDGVPIGGAQMLAGLNGQLALGGANIDQLAPVLRFLFAQSTGGNLFQMEQTSSFSTKALAALGRNASLGLGLYPQTGGVPGASFGLGWEPMLDIYDNTDGAGFRMGCVSKPAGQVRAYYDGGSDYGDGRITFQMWGPGASFVNTLTTKNGKVGVGGVIAPVSTLEGDGDIETNNVGSGFILKSPNGTRWRIAVSNGGVLSANAV